MTDEELVAFCRAQYPRLVRILGLYCGDRGVAEELAQETLARVWRRWPTLHHLDHPQAWAEHVAINLANSHFRRLVAERKAKRRMPPVEERSQIDTDEALAMRREVARLPRRQREALILHYYLDLELAEVAARMGSTVPAVKSLLHRAVIRLRAQHHELLEVPDVT